MIVLNKEMAFISYYLAEKEYFLPDRLRDALSYIYFLIRVKHKDKALAIHLTNEKYINEYNIIYSKEFLWKKYNARLAYIKNAKDKYKLWNIEIKEKSIGITKKLCECGCGQEVAKKNNRFINGHNVKCRSNEKNIELASKMRNVKESKKSRDVISMVDRIPKKYQQG